MENTYFFKERPEPLRTLEVWAIALRPPKAVRRNEKLISSFQGKSLYDAGNP